MAAFQLLLLSFVLAAVAAAGSSQATRTFRSSHFSRHGEQESLLGGSQRLHYGHRFHSRSVRRGPNHQGEEDSLPSAVLQTADDQCAAEWGQCGGKSWTGPKCCEGFMHCIRQDDSYSQCKKTCMNEYEQCGGDGYTGPTCCANDLTCIKGSQYFSSCLKPGSNPPVAPPPSTKATTASDSSSSGAVNTNARTNSVSGDQGPVVSTDNNFLVTQNQTKALSIAGVVLGSLAVCGIIGGVIFFFVWRARNVNAEDSPAM